MMPGGHLVPEMRLGKQWAKESLLMKRNSWEALGSSHQRQRGRKPGVQGGHRRGETARDRDVQWLGRGGWSGGR